MTIRVLFFAALAYDLGAKGVALELPPGATVGQALDLLTRAHPALQAARGKLALAVDMTYVQASHVLKDGDELALIPPVSGG